MYVIENMQSGEIAKGIAEALEDMGIYAKRLYSQTSPSRSRVWIPSLMF
jgi:hypothetical protein